MAGVIVGSEASRLCAARPCSVKICQLPELDSYTQTPYQGWDLLIADS